MKKLVRDHRTLGVELARNQVEIEGRQVPVVIYQTDPEGMPRSMFGGGAMMSVEEEEVKRYFVSQFFQTMTQALYFGLSPNVVQNLAGEALSKAQQYINSMASQDAKPMSVEPEKKTGGI